MDRLERMISQTSLENNWYSVGNQKKYTFLMATTLVVEHGIDVDTALDLANELCVKFYKLHINPQG